MPFSISEILGALLWAASAVSVAGYTWDSFKSTYQQFPGVSGGLGEKTAVPQNSDAAKGADVQAAIHKLPVVGPILKSSANITGPILDPTGPYVSAEDVVRLEKLPAPPKGLVVKLKQNANANRAQVFNRDAQTFLQWAKRNGYQNRDAVNYLRYLGIFVTNGMQLIYIPRPRTRTGQAIRPGR